MSATPKKVKAIPVREFLKFTPVELMGKITGFYTILFEDGVVKDIPSNILIFSRYFWILVDEFPDIKIRSTYLISEYFTNGLLTNKSHNSFFSDMLRDYIVTVLRPNNTLSQNILSEIYLIMYKIINEIYSELLYNILEYSTSLDILDLLEVQLDPNVMEAINQVKDERSVGSINNAYDVLDTAMRSERLRNNTVCKQYISGAINANQAKQVLGPRGYVTEIDSSIFKYPIASSFTLGMDSMYDMATESRSAAKALYLANKAIQDSEYFARELQLSTMVIEKLVQTDCGNDQFSNWYVQPPEVYEGITTYEGDLSGLEGKSFKDPETGETGMITSKMTHLYGKIIKIRSSLNCRLTNKHHVCTACFGELSHGVPAHSNLGHICTTNLTRAVTQSILSTKHLTSSATTTSIKLDDVAKAFFTVKDKNGYSIKPEWQNTKKGRMSIIISHEQCFGIKDLRADQSINKINPARTTRIEFLTVMIEHEGKKNYYPINIKIGNRIAHLELKFLDYIIHQGYTSDDNGNYIFDMSGWKLVSPILRLPALEFSFFVFGNEIKSLLATRFILKDGTAKDSPEVLLSKLFTLVNSKLNVNIALLEVIVMAFVVEDLGENNFDLGRNSLNPQLASMQKIIDGRSLGSAYAWSKLVAKIIHPDAFDDTHKPASVLDVLIKPNEVIEHYHNK